MFSEIYAAQYYSQCSTCVPGTQYARRNLITWYVSNNHTKGFLNK